MSNRLRAHEQNIITLSGGVGSARVHQQNIIVHGGFASKRGRVSEQNTVLITGGAENRSVARVHEQNVVLVVGEGDIEPGALDVLAFQYDLDGHLFYGLHVKGRGTFLHDFTTGQWSQWATGPFTLWNAQFHLQWSGAYYAASVLDNSLIKIDPDSIVDDGFRENDFIATGRLEFKDRRYIANPEAQIFGSVGLRGGQVTLRYSNNDGETWSSGKVRTVPANDRADNVLFRNLGSVRAPGRLYQIEDKGTIRRIQTLRVKLDNNDE